MRTRIWLAVATVLATIGAGSPALADAPSETVGVVDQTTGIWYLRDAMTGATTSFYYGNPGDYPIVGDWDCTGTDTPGLYRQSDGYVYLRNANTQGNADIRFFFGNPGDVPLAGDFDGDGCDTVSIYRPSEARIYVINKLGANNGGLGAADYDFYFGNPGDKPFTGDFNNNGQDTVGLHRESTGFVYYRNTLTTGIADNDFFYGDPSDQIVTGRWAQDPAKGPDTVGIFRPSNGRFYLRFENSQGNANVDFSYGNPNMAAVAGYFGVLPGGDPAPPDNRLIVSEINQEVQRVCALMMTDGSGTAIADVASHIQFDPRWEPVVTLADVESRVDACAGIDYLISIALGFEYGSASPIVRKWARDVRIIVDGAPTTGDLAALDATIGDLNRLINSIEVTRVTSGPAEITVHFVPLAQMGQVIPGYVTGNWGFFAVYWDYSSALSRATAAIASDVTTQTERSHLVREEVTQAFGLARDSYTYSDSIFQQRWSYVTEYLPMDEVIIALLYRPEVRLGMDQWQLRQALDWNLDI